MSTGADLFVVVGLFQSLLDTDIAQFPVLIAFITNRKGTFGINQTKMGFFSNLSNNSKSAELEQLLNQTMKATVDWESSKTTDLMLKAATSIKLNISKIVTLYGDLAKSNRSKNLYIKNNTLPPPMPRDLSVQMGIMAILHIAEDLGEANSSFKHQLVTQDTLNAFNRIINNY